MGYFWVFSSTFAQTSYLFTFRFLAFRYVLIFQTQTETETKKSDFLPFFAVICPFLSQIKRWLSVIYRYIGQTTPHTPTFGTRRVGQLSSEIFFIFLFFIFCKILWFCQFSFSTQFWAFLKVLYLLFFLHKVSLYLLLAISVRHVAFYVASWCSLSPDYF